MSDRMGNIMQALGNLNSTQAQKKIAARQHQLDKERLDFDKRKTVGDRTYQTFSTGLQAAGMGLDMWNAKQQRVHEKQEGLLNRKSALDVVRQQGENAVGVQEVVQGGETARNDARIESAEDLQRELLKHGTAMSNQDFLNSLKYLRENDRLTTAQERELMEMRVDEFQRTSETRIDEIEAAVTAETEGQLKVMLRQYGYEEAQALADYKRQYAFYVAQAKDAQLSALQQHNYAIAEIEKQLELQGENQLAAIEAQGAIDEELQGNLFEQQKYLQGNSQIHEQLMQKAQARSAENLARVQGAETRRNISTEFDERRKTTEIDQATAEALAAQGYDATINGIRIFPQDIDMSSLDEALIQEWPVTLQAMKDTYISQLGRLDTDLTDMATQTDNPEKLIEYIVTAAETSGMQIPTIDSLREMDLEQLQQTAGDVLNNSPEAALLRDTIFKAGTVQFQGIPERFREAWEASALGIFPWSDQGSAQSGGGDGSSPIPQRLPRELKDQLSNEQYADTRDEITDYFSATGDAAKTRELADALSSAQEIFLNAARAGDQPILSRDKTEAESLISELDEYDSRFVPEDYMSMLQSITELDSLPTNVPMFNNILRAIAGGATTGDAMGWDVDPRRLWDVNQFK